jgi:hypothetical protein
MNNGDCNTGKCRTADECFNTCMVPCDDPSVCPVTGMGCEHGYCLFPCKDNDADCLQPGFTCQHGPPAKWCEND